MRIVWAFAALSSLAVVTSAAAQDKPNPPTPPTSACYDISQPQKDMVPFEPILVDHCTGSTWLLVRAPMPDAKGQDGGAYVYRWFPIAMESVEAQLHAAPLSSPVPGFPLPQPLAPGRKP
jgi:hypothetical protein